MINRVELLRTERGWTADELAERLGVSVMTINTVERGTYEPTLSLAAAMARLFACRIDDIFPTGGQETPTDGKMRTERVTFLYTDIVGSTRLLGRLGERYVEALEGSRAALRESVADRDGRVLDEVGDAGLFVFRRAPDAVDAIIAARRRLAATSWPEDEAVRVRAGVHTGEAYVVGTFGERYVGLAVHEAARVCSLARKGEVFVSGTARDELEGTSARLEDRGAHDLAGLEGKYDVYELLEVR